MGHRGVIMRVLTYNIHDGIGLDGQFSLERLARVIQTWEADLVGLQEVPRYVRNAAHLDSMRALAEMTGLFGTFGASYTVLTFPPVVAGAARAREWPGFGNALLSRYPIRWAEVHPLAYFEYEGSYWERRSVLEARVVAPDGDLTVFVTHFGLNAAERAEQARELARRVAAVTGPVVVMGDFNDLPDTLPIRELEQVLEQVRPPAPLLTFPADAPDRQLDYLFVRGLRTETGPTVVPSHASDHLPVWADLGVAGGAE